MLSSGFLWERGRGDCTFLRVIVPMARRDATKREGSTEFERRGNLGAASRSKGKGSPESNRKQIHSQRNKHRVRTVRRLRGHGNSGTRERRRKICLTKICGIRKFYNHLICLYHVFY